MRISKRSVLLLCLLALTSCFAEQRDEAEGPLDLALLLDTAEITGEAAEFVAKQSGQVLWRKVFYEGFEKDPWERWVPAPNHLLPGGVDADMQRRWHQDAAMLRKSARLVSDNSGREPTMAMQVQGPFDLKWAGYVVPIPVKGGRTYRVSVKIKAIDVDVIDPQRVGYVGFLELDKPLPLKSVYFEDEILPHIVAEQKSPGAKAGESVWRQESFRLELNEMTESLFLYLCVYEGSGMKSGKVLFDDLLVEELDVSSLPEYIDHAYLTPGTSKVSSRKHLFKVAGWGNPTKVSHHLEGIVSPGESAFSFTLENQRFDRFSFNYGPLREFATLSKGRMTFEVQADDVTIFSDTYDFASGEGKAGWRKRSLILPDAFDQLTLKTSIIDLEEDVVGFWGAPRLLPTISKSKRNVLFICVDSLRSDFIGLYGDVDAMPVFSELARDGLSYDHFVSAGNGTRYAQTALFTGNYTGQNGLHLETVYDRLSDNFRKQFAETVPTLPGLFRDHGYLTFASIDNPFLLPGATGLHMGFSQIYNDGVEEGAYRLTTSRTIEFLKENHSAPFFAFVHYDPDFLWKLRAYKEGTLSKRMLKSAYYYELESINAEVEMLLQFLKQGGVYDDTDIVLFSDHGESLDPQRPGHGFTLDPDQVIVPLVYKPVRLERSRHGVRISTPVSTVDLAPLLAEAHNLPVPPSFVGLPESVLGDNEQDRVIYSEGLNDHRLLILNKTGTYLLHKDGKDEYFGPEPHSEALPDYRILATRFLVNSVPGLYLWLNSPQKGDDSRHVQIKGARDIRFIGLGVDQSVDRKDLNTEMTLASNSGPVLIIVPLNEMTFPLELSIGKKGESVPLAIPPEFLPVHKGAIQIDDRVGLSRFAHFDIPQTLLTQGDNLVWFRPGHGVAQDAADQAGLDPALRSMLQRWGYLK